MLKEIRTLPPLEDAVCTRLQDHHATNKTSIARHDDHHTRGAALSCAAENVFIYLSPSFEWLEAASRRRSTVRPFTIVNVELRTMDL